MKGRFILLAGKQYIVQVLFLSELISSLVLPLILLSIEGFCADNLFAPSNALHPTSSSPCPPQPS